MKSLHYRPEIDGLRALAVIPVVLYHAELGFPGGYVGVDVFFVISGYLITSLIIRDLDAGIFSLPDFWSRRVRRIIPAVSVVMAVSLIAGYFIFWPDDYMDLGFSAAAQSVFVSNVYFWMQAGYFEGPSIVKPLLHTWSLSVEEQYYLVFPLLLMALTRWSSASRTRLITVVAAGSFLLSVYGSYKHPSATFYLIPTRAWELLIGALLAMKMLAFIKLSKRTTELLSWLGLIMIVCSVVFYNSDMRFPGVAAVVPVLGAIFIIWSNTRQLTLLGRMLSCQPLVFIGLISYSLYLWHWPALVFSQYWSLEELNIPARLGLVAASIIVAAASWKWVELPFRKKGVVQGSSKVVVLGALSLTMVLASGLVVAKMGGMPQRVTSEVAAYAAGKKDRIPVSNMSVGDALKGEFVHLGADDQKAARQVIVWGDSHAKAVMPVIERLCLDYAVQCFGAAHSSTAPLLEFESQTKHGLKEDSIPFNAAVLKYIKNQKIKNVVMVALWRGYGLEKDETKIRKQLLATVDAIESAGARAWIMLEAPSHSVDIPRALARAVLAGQDITTLGVPVDIQREKIAFQREIFSGIGKDVVVLDPLEYLTGDNGHCLVAGDGKSYYSDNHHLSVHGAMKLRAMFQPIFQASK